MAGHEPDKVIYLTAYNDEVAHVKQFYPDLDNHGVRLRVAQTLRPRFQQDLASERVERSGEGEYEVKDQFTLTRDGRAQWIGYGRYMDELDERTQTLTPGRYEATDRPTTSAIESALRIGARRIVTSYALPGDDNRDLLVIEYNPDTNRGTMKIINTTTNGNHHDFESLQQAAKERFAGLELNRISQTTFLFTDIKFPKDQPDVVHPDAHAISVIKPSDTLRNEIDNKREATDAGFNSQGQRGNILINTVDIARYAGRKTVSEVGITLKRVKEAIREAKVKRHNGKQVVNKGIDRRFRFMKNRQIERKSMKSKEKNQIRRAQNSRVIEGNKVHKESFFQIRTEKREGVIVLKKQKELPRRQLADVVIFTRGEQKRVKRRTMKKIVGGIMLTEKMVLKSTEPAGNSVKKKGKLRTNVARFENKKAKKKEYKKDGFTQKEYEKRVRILTKEKPHKREKQLRRALVTVAHLIERRRHLERVRPELKKLKKGKEKKATSLSHLETQRFFKEKQTDIYLAFSFAWILYGLIKTERIFIGLSTMYPKHFNKLPSEEHGLRSINKVEGQVMALKKQGKEDSKNDSLPTYETTPWILLSIIWYLTMLREAGIQSSNQQSTQSNQQVASVVLPVLPIRHQGIIFAYHS